MAHSFGKAVYWSLWILVLGLVQFWIHIAIDVYQEDGVFELQYYTKDGVLLFFSLAVTQGVYLDYALHQADKPESGFLIFSMFKLIPIVVTVFCVVSYLLMKLTEAEKFLSILDFVSVTCVVLAMAYSLVVKAYLFFADKQLKQAQRI